MYNERFEVKIFHDYVRYVIFNEDLSKFGQISTIFSKG